MEKKELEKIISEVFVPKGFKKKGNYWVVNGNEIIKMIYLQKSQFSNSFFINYGYILNSIPLGSLMMHIFNGLGSIKPDENTRIKELLDFDSNITEEIRILELKGVLIDIMLPRIQKVNTENDILIELNLRPHLNDLPGVVKEYFHLE